MATKSRATVEIELAEEILRSFGDLQFVARGASMLPAIYPGDVLVIARSPNARVRGGQVVLASRDGRFFAHRVVGKTNAGGRHLVFTRGDALTEDDPPVADADLLGRVTAVIRGGRRIEVGEVRPERPSVLQWAVQRSNLVAGLLLRWNSLRTTIARDSVSMPGQLTENLAECSDER
jgi:signal peptidase